MHEWFTAEDTEEAVPMLFCVVYQIVHVVKADQMLRLIHVHPATLTTEVTAVGDRDVKKRRECDALAKTLLKALNRPHAFIAKIIGELPD